MPVSKLQAIMTSAYAVRVIDALSDGTQTRTHDGVNLT
jgi:hypothetical protein